MYRLQPGQSRTSKPSLSSAWVTTYASPQRHSWEKLPPSASSKCISSTFTFQLFRRGSIHTQNEMRHEAWRVFIIGKRHMRDWQQDIVVFAQGDLTGFQPNHLLPLRNVCVDALVRRHAHLIGHDDVPSL